MTHVDYCHTCNKKWEYEDLHDKEHYDRLISHAIDRDHKFTTYRKGNKDGEFHARMAGVPKDV